MGRKRDSWHKSHGSTLPRNRVPPTAAERTTVEGTRSGRARVARGATVTPTVRRRPKRKAPSDQRHELVLFLEREHQRQYEIHAAAAPRNGIPIGGGDWMDSFFRMEAIRGCLTGLRRGLSIDAAIDEGKAAGRFAVERWNSQREWQVHRDKDTASWFLDAKIIQFRKSNGE